MQSSPNGVPPIVILTVACALMYHREVRFFLFSGENMGGC
jgi:hypothetical protein